MQFEACAECCPHELPPIEIGHDSLQCQMRLIQKRSIAFDVAFFINSMRHCIMPTALRRTLCELQEVLRTVVRCPEG